MIEWNSISFEELKTKKDSKGNSYLLLFLEEYKQLTGDKPCVSCGSLPNTYKKFQKMNKTNINDCKYRLKNMFEGIQLSFGSPVHVFNHSITNKQAEELIKNHPHGKELFDVIPSNNKTKSDAQK